MSAVAVHNGAWVLIGDGRRALFFSNHGDAEILDLRVIETRVDENPPTREQGSDAPGRAFAAAGAHARSGMGNVARRKFRRRLSQGACWRADFLPFSSWNAICGVPVGAPFFVGLPTYVSARFCVLCTIVLQCDNMARGLVILRDSFRRQVGIYSGESFSAHYMLQCTSSAAYTV